jgi:hypothetical protein
MVNVIGMFDWAANGYHFEDDRPVILDVMTAGWPYLTRKEWHGLIVGDIKFKRRGETIEVELELDADKFHEAQRDELMDEVRETRKKLNLFKETLTQFVDTIDATGGVVEVEDGHTAPVADEEWIDLGEVYLTAKEALAL